MVEQVSGKIADLTGFGITETITEESIILLPVGAIEQHGPHLPLSVDAVIAEETALAVLESVGQEVDLWLLPTLTVSKSNEHTWSSGTLSFSAETMLRVLNDIASCVATTAARKLVFLNGHGGNTKLQKIPKGKRVYSVTILETAPSSYNDKQIIKLEEKWKKKLGSRAFGLNSN